MAAGGSGAALPRLPRGQRGAAQLPEEPELSWLPRAERAQSQRSPRTAAAGAASARGAASSPRQIMEPGGALAQAQVEHVQKASTAEMLRLFSLPASPRGAPLPPGSAGGASKLNPLQARLQLALRAQTFLEERLLPLQTKCAGAW